MKDDAEDIHDGFGRANGVTEPERKSMAEGNFSVEISAFQLINLIAYNFPILILSIVKTQLNLNQ